MSDTKQAAALKTLSPDLQRILELELALGNAVQAVDVDAWTQSPLVVTLRDPLHVNEIRTKLGLPSERVKLWENHDTHYPLQRGFACEETNHSLCSPLSPES